MYGRSQISLDILKSGNAKPLKSKIFQWKPSLPNGKQKFKT
jgi:hypothetical protein